MGGGTSKNQPIRPPKQGVVEESGEDPRGEQIPRYPKGPRQRARFLGFGAQNTAELVSRRRGERQLGGRCLTLKKAFE